MTDVRRWTAPPAEDELLTLAEVAAYLALNPDNPVHMQELDGLLFEADEEAAGDRPERWKVNTIKRWVLDEDPQFTGDADLLDLAGIAAYLGVAATTPQQWRQRLLLLPEEEDVSFPDKPLWRRWRVRRWAMGGDPMRWPPGVAGRKRD